MAWIESHTELEQHPKTKNLKILMGWDIDTTIGKLHRFWWWVLKYAEDGDLRRFNDAQIADSVALNGESSMKFVDAMVEAGFIDRQPFFRVHDWLERTERYLVSKYHSSNPAKLKEIRRKYQGRRVGQPKGQPPGQPKGQSKDAIPNLTLPNQPNQPNLTFSAKEFISKYCESFKSLYGINPHISKKEAGIAGRLIQIPDIEVIMERFFKSKDKFILENRHSLNIIESQINKLLIGELDKFSGIKEWLREKEGKIDKK